METRLVQQKAVTTQQAMTQQMTDKVTDGSIAHPHSSRAWVRKRYLEQAYDHPSRLVRRLNVDLQWMRGIAGRFAEVIAGAGKHWLCCRLANSWWCSMAPS
jgi:hypothetical protein